MMIGNFKRITQIAPKAIELLERTQQESEFFGGPYNTNIYSGLLSMYGLALYSIGRMDDAEQVLEKASRFAIATNDPLTIGMAHHFYFGAAFFQPTLATWNHYRLAREAFEKANSIQLLGIHLSCSALLYLYEGRLEEAREDCQHSLKLNEAAGTPYFSAAFNVSMGIIELMSGNMELSQSYLEDAVSISTQTGERFHEGIGRTYLGKFWSMVENPDYEKAIELINEAAAIYKELELTPMLATTYSYLGETYADAGQIKKALVMLRKAEDMCREMKMDFWLRRTQRILKRLEEG
jgi:tetratricopeptide (TPR) repeat protein